MSLFEGIEQTLEQQAAAAVAAKMGIDASMAQTALSALAQNHAAPGDTIDQASQQTGLSTDMLSQIMGHIGGAGGLGALAGALCGNASPAPDGAPPAADGLGGILSGLGGLGGVASMLDRDGDGNPLNDIAAMLGKN